jgi:molecular chaperone DnaK
VTFDIDANGIVNVSAKDKQTSKEQSIRIQASGGLSETDIQRMVKDAEAHASEDKKRRELIESRNHLEQLAHATEKSLKDSGDKVTDAVKSEVEAAIKSAREAAQGESVETIKTATQTLAQAALKIGEAVYGGQQPGGAQPGGDGGGAGADQGQGSENVVDADFEEVKDDKKKQA